MLELEIRVPPGHPARDSLKAREFRVGLVVSSKDRAYVDLDFASLGPVRLAGPPS